MYHRLYKGPEYLRFAHLCGNPSGGRWPPAPGSRKRGNRAPGREPVASPAPPALKKKKNEKETTKKKEKTHAHKLLRTHAFFFFLVCRFFSFFFRSGRSGFPTTNCSTCVRNRSPGDLGNGRGRSLRNASRMLVYRHFPCAKTLLRRNSVVDFIHTCDYIV